MQARKTLEDIFDDLSNADPAVVLKNLNYLYNRGPLESRLVGQLITLLSDPNWRIRAGAVRCLEHAGEQTDAAVTALIVALNDPMARVRANAAVALGSIGPKSIPEVQAEAIHALTEALNDSHQSVRVTSSIALNTIMGHVRYEPAIQGMQNRAVEKKLPKPETVERYLLALKDADPKKKISAMHKLSDVVCAGQADLNALIIFSVPDLIVLLGDPSWKVRTWAARLLGRIGPDAYPAVPHLISALQDQIISVRSCAAYALGRLGEKANVSIPALEKTLHDPVRSVRTAAHMALRNLKHMDDLLGAKTNEEDTLTGYRVHDPELDIHYWVLGYVKPHSGNYWTNLFAKIKKFTLGKLMTKRTRKRGK